MNRDIDKNTKFLYEGEVVQLTGRVAESTRGKYKYEVKTTDDGNPGWDGKPDWCKWVKFSDLHVILDNEEALVGALEKENNNVIS